MFALSLSKLVTTKSLSFLKHRDPKNNDEKYHLLSHSDSFEETFGSIKDTSPSNPNHNDRSKKYNGFSTNMRNGVDYVNPAQEDQMEIYGYQSSFIHQTITWLLMIVTLGLLRLLFHWKPHWMLICSHKRCKLKDASKVLLVDSFSQIYVETVRTLFSTPLSCISTNTKANSFYPPWSSSVVLKNFDGTFKDVDCVTYFENKNVRYIWTEDTKEFVKLTGLDVNVDCSFFYKQQGLSSCEQEKRLKLFGPNSITVEVQSIFHILFNEVLEPFYVFQIFSIVLWCSDNYYYYASCILIMSALSLGSSLIQIRRNQRQLRDTVQGTDAVTVCREKDKLEEIESSKLVPGDVIVIPPYGCVMQCDAVLISGNAIVNESMLTGESVPVTKIPLLYHEDELYNSKEHAKHTLFCGTKVIQTRFYDGGSVKAVVIRTGFLTSKGELVRSIMFPKPVDFHFNRHILKFILVLASLAGIGFIYSIILNINRGASAQKLVVKALDLITVVVPPALPVAMTVGVIYAQSRLRRSNIYCISPRSINISGCINCVCFDKTGTLTEDDLSFSEVIPVDKRTRRFGFPLRNLMKLETDPIITCLASCHSLTIIGDNLVGDPLDLKMFQATGWVLEELNNIESANKYDFLAPSIVKPGSSCNSGDEAINDIEVGIVRQFPFSSSLQRMSVITRSLGDDEYVLYSKGAPEMISKLCLKATLPANFSDVLMEYTEKGYRVLALAQKMLLFPPSKMHRAPREDIEKDMEFLGLLVMSNVLKPETTYIIQTLSTANIRCVMITGDNMLTALSVGRESMMIKPTDQVVLLEAIEHESCDITPPILTWRYANSHQYRSPAMEFVKIDMEPDSALHVAVTGKTFRILRDFYPDLLNKVAIRGTIFARMGPEQKQQLIELLQSLGYYVAMCGDGANDCGALKAAHAGISLSDTEASVASPFTSKTPNISCIPILIREGRASLATAFGILKYMACYSLAQFISVIILYSVRSNLSDTEYLYIDLFLISVFFMLFGRTESFTELSKHPPPSSLIGVVPLTSLALQIFLIVIFQLAAIFSIWAQPWYRFHVPESEDDSACHDNYAIFAVSVFQYISLAFVFSKGAPYRKPIYSNTWFMLSIMIMTLITTYLILIPHPWIAQVMELDIRDIPYEFRVWCLVVAFLNFVASYFAESYLVDRLIHEKLMSQEWNKAFSRESPYQRIDRLTKNTTNWLPPRLCLPRNFSDFHVTGLELGDDLDFNGKNSPDNNGASSKESNSESGISLSSPASMASERV